MVRYILRASSVVAFFRIGYIGTWLVDLPGYDDLRPVWGRAQGCIEEDIVGDESKALW